MNYDLLISDLGSRINSGVILCCCDMVGEELLTIDKNGLVNNDYDIEEVKPFLFPMSSMTEEQNLEYLRTCFGRNASIPTLASFVWLLKNHFDIHGLIPMGLTNDATGLEIYGK